ncbi:VWA domain-containing protein [Clostridium oryzae]|uniref:von Willebrand factor type A domain protein n=1 Tax=Clostridium oryzae TaxID=1450648 RepID=A0A1V4ITC9_9CLOT|nr:VWA domain-containing protein [Clostridium oryzae]OPJ63070.1 von Willebrand factor type A domain protein [Clostridium oryzae]
MRINFTAPYFLMLIPVFIAIVVYIARSLNRFSKNKKRIIIALRCFVIIFLVMSLCGTTFYWRMNSVTTIFLIDASDSTAKYRESMEKFINSAVKLKKNKDNVGVISFGQNSQVEAFINKKLKFTKIEGAINSNYTNIENAISSAAAMFPEDTNKRLVILSDGCENLGAAKKIIPSLMSQGIEFKFYKIDKQREVYDAEVDNLKVPENLTLGQEFDIEVTVNSSIAQNAKLILYSGRQKSSEQAVRLQNGVNKFIFKDKAKSGGLKFYRVVLKPERDSQALNDEASAFTQIKAKPQILLIEGKKREADELARMLKASSAKYKLVNAAGAPSTVQEMTNYKTIITCNVAVDDLSKGFMNSIESYVKDFGGGFIATGGDNSFALGGYKGTSLEKLLPVYMDMKGKKEIPKMDMVLVIDKSGSMTESEAGISKVAMAKQAAAESLKSLRAGKDELGVIAFDEGYSWVVKNKVINNVKKSINDIGTIRADGGTSILPSLSAAYNSLKHSNAKIKHVILLTDGEAENSGYDELLNKMNKNKITVSTVAVGQDADAKLLKSIASKCEGRCYITNEYTNIPRIFTKETYMAAKVYLNNRKFTPVVENSHSVLSGAAEGGLPQLLGYIGASPKETATVVLKSDRDDPILSLWQCGLGRTVAWNSDVSGKWNANYVGWDKNLRLWQNIINYTVKNYNSSSASMEVNRQGQQAKISFTDKKNGSSVATKAAIIDPSGKSRSIKLYETSPGKYSAAIKLSKTGVYMINGRQTKNGRVISSVNTGYALQYSPEYKMGQNGSKFIKLVRASNGKIIKHPKQVFTNDIIRKSGEVDLSQKLLALAILIFMLDVAVRRLNINIDKFRQKMKSLSPIKRPLKQTIASISISTASDLAGVTSDRKVDTYDSIDRVKPEKVKGRNDGENSYQENQAKSSNMLDTSELLKNIKKK